MSDRLTTTRFLIDTGVVAVVRADDPRLLTEAAAALADGGVKAIEITMTTPGALGVIAALAARPPAGCVIGVGTVLDAETARAAILAGAGFLVAPVLDLRTIELAHRYDKAVLPGAFTPTEILAAWQAGADLVKVFPADTLGPAYIRAVKAPLPQVRMCPTGGVTAENAGEWIRAGASCVAAGGSLISKRHLADRDLEGIRASASRFAAAVREARAAGG
jgi:2-dehydro-3-deoxyphosphogluconate aldolase/(4S)-4-hydroxy-2-oxoglutarate aldolase